METAGKPRYGINSYLDWTETEGIRVAYGVSLNMFEVRDGPLARLGVKGAPAIFAGSGDYSICSSSATGRRLRPLAQQHLYEEIYYVLEGRGSTSWSSPTATSAASEWGPHSFFANRSTPSTATSTAAGPAAR